MGNPEVTELNSVKVNCLQVSGLLRVE